MTLETVAIILVITLMICFIGMIVAMMTDRMEISGVLLVGTLASFLALITVVCIGSGRDANRLMKQCMDDGKKEYECHAMLDKRSQVVPMPVIIPMVR